MTGARAGPHKKTEITIETERVVVIRRKNARRGWCPECGREVDMVSLAEAGALTGTTPGALPDAALGRRHVVEKQNGVTLVCLDSLLEEM